LFVLLRGGFSIHYHSADEEGVLVLSARTPNPYGVEH
jgi:hypothetical protein